jgi:hypothetical protein
MDATASMDAGSTTSTIDWDRPTQSRIVWLRQSVEKLSAEPFTLCQGVVVTAPREYFSAVLRDIDNGPTGLRGGLIPDELRKIQAAIGPKRIDLRPSAAKRGYGSVAWRAARAAFVQAHPFCQPCLARGIEKATREVDHRPPLEGPDDPGLLDENRMIANCRSCHAKVTHADRRQGRTRLYERGTPSEVLSAGHNDGSTLQNFTGSRAAADAGALHNLAPKKRLRQTLTLRPAMVYTSWRLKKATSPMMRKDG